MKPSMRTSRRVYRRGTIYLIVLGTSMLVTLLGLSAITLGRIQARGSVGSGDIEDARAYARSAIEYGRLFVNNDPNWRTNRVPGTWINKYPIGGGRFSLSAVNPNSPNLNNSPTDPLVLTGSGGKGTAVQLMKVTLVSANSPLTCLGAALAAGGSISLNLTTVNADHPLCSNGSITAILSAVNAPVEACTGVYGISASAYNVNNRATARTFPTASTVFNSYSSLGTPISYGSLPSGKITGALLSPTSNPYGGGTNPQGIYVIDCAGSTLTIQNSRIVGTLILLNAGPFTNVQGSVNWATTTANYPALMVQGSLYLSCTNAPLSEATVGVNFNPAGTPYAGASNATTTDTYPSQIQGLIYCTGDLTTSSHQVVKGVIAAGGGWSGSGYLDITYDGTFFSNPPPGFYVTQMLISDGTWAQVVN